MILKNPQGIVNEFGIFCISLVNFNDEVEDLNELATKILQEFKYFAGDNWNMYYQKFPNHIRQALSQKFNI